MVVVYYAVPVGTQLSTARLVGSVVLTLAGVALFDVVFVAALVSTVASSSRSRSTHLGEGRRP
jgi:hypothetical protein